MIHSSIINISSKRLIQWMNVIRDTSGASQYRLLENFWASQVNSKAWIINTLKTLDWSHSGNVYVFGGWYGILASLIKDNFPSTEVYSIDIDSSCEDMGNRLDNRIKFITSDMKNFQFKNASLVINTSTEHITQETFDSWKQNVPQNTLVILQGNNYYTCSEHIRCTDSLEDFISINGLSRILYADELDCGEFNRFMIIGYK